MTNAQFTSLTTNATGTTWTAFASISPATTVHVLNNTGTTLEFRRSGGTAAVFQLPTSMAWSFKALTNSSQLECRRVDTSNTQVTVFAEVENGK